jgi:hypothetical protein
MNCRYLIATRKQVALTLRAETDAKFRYTFIPGRGTQVVRERSAKPLYVGSIPTRASNNSPIKIGIADQAKFICSRIVPAAHLK